MALRIRANGRVFCAAHSVKEEGDLYIDDGLHYELSAVNGVLVTEYIDDHISSGGEWWWRYQVPPDLKIDWREYMTVDEDFKAYRKNDKIVFESNNKTVSLSQKDLDNLDFRDAPCEYTIPLIEKL